MTERDVSVRVSGAVWKKVASRARRHNRTVAGQAEFYLRAALAAEDNPDLPFTFIQDILEAEEERKAGKAVAFEY